MQHYFAHCWQRNIVLVEAACESQVASCFRPHLDSEVQWVSRDMSMILQELHYSVPRTSECGTEVPFELLCHGGVPGLTYCMDSQQDPILRVP